MIENFRKKFTPRTVNGKTQIKRHEKIKAQVYEQILLQKNPTSFKEKRTVIPVTPYFFCPRVVITAVA